ncbi:MAG: hypothetical protein H6510_06780 [Acidobacteria bacterium]|nr:hypothetical protein [Acidobacteriota bacterium]MCB9397500.1 hypothetical protein [Acidobacteriota bacterium]
MLFAFCGLLLGIDGFQTGVFKRISPSETAYHVDFGIYIYDKGEVAVKRFSEAGELLSQFVQRGQGPGELQDPFVAELYFFNDQLFVSSFSKTLIFSAEGKWVRDVSAPAGFQIHKVEKGWLAHNSGPRFNARKIVIKYFNDDFSEQKILASWDVPIESLALPYMYRGVGGFAISKDHRRFFMIHPNSFTIDVFDSVSLEKIKTVSESIEPQEVPTGLKKKYPRSFGQMSTYPCISTWDTTGRGIILKNFHDEMRPNLFLISNEGELTRNLENPAGLSNKLGAHNGMIYFFYFDENEDELMIGKTNENANADFIIQSVVKENIKSSP